MPGEAALNLIKLFFLFALSARVCVLLSFIALSGAARGCQLKNK